MISFNEYYNHLNNIVGLMQQYHPTITKEKAKQLSSDYYADETVMKNYNRLYDNIRIYLWYKYKIWDEVFLINQTHLPKQIITNIDFSVPELRYFIGDHLFYENELIQSI